MKKEEELKKLKKKVKKLEKINFEWFDEFQKIDNYILDLTGGIVIVSKKSPAKNIIATIEEYIRRIKKTD